MSFPTKKQQQEAQQEIPSFDEVMTDTIPSFDDVMGEKKNLGGNDLKNGTALTSPSKSSSLLEKSVSAFKLRPIQSGINADGTAILKNPDKLYNESDDTELSNLSDKYKPATVQGIYNVADVVNKSLGVPKDKTSEVSINPYSAKLQEVTAVETAIKRKAFEKQLALNRTGETSMESGQRNSLTPEEDNELKNLQSIKNKISAELTVEGTDEVDALIRTDQSGSLLNKAVTRAKMLMGDVTGSIELSQETEDKISKLPPEFFTGLNYFKNAEPVVFERLTNSIANNLPISESQVAQITAEGLAIEQARLERKVNLKEIEPEEFNKQIAELQTKKVSNLLNNKETLRAALSNGIAESLDNLERLKAPQGSNDLGNSVFGFRWNYDDNEIKLSGEKWAQDHGLDPSNPNVQEAIKYLQDNEGAMILDNSIAKSGIVRELGKGLAEPIRGISASLESLSKGIAGDTNSVYVEGQSQGNVNVSEQRLKAEDVGWKGVVNDVTKGAGQFATQAGIAIGTSGLIGGIAEGVGGIASGSRLVELAAGEIGQSINVAKDFAATLTTSFAQVYDSNLKTALNYTSDNGAAKNAAFINSTIEGLSENILSPIDIVKGIKIFKTKGAQEGLLKVLTEENLLKNPNKLTDFLKSTLNAGIATTKVAGTEIAEEFVTQIADFATNAYLNPNSKSFEDRNLANELAQTAYQTGLSMAIPALANGIGAANANSFAKGSLMIAAQNRQSLLDNLTESLASNKISQDEFNRKAFIINNAAKANQSLPLKADGTPMTSDEKADYIFSRVSEAVLKKKIEDSNDEAEKTVDSQKIKEQQDFRTEILTPAPIVAENVVDTPLADNATATPTDNATQKEDAITVGDMIDKVGSYKGQNGSFRQDGQTVVFKVEGQNKEYELGNIEEIKGNSISEFGIEHEQSVVGVDDNGNINVRDVSYVNNFSDPLQAINRDADGNIVSVNLETADGNKRTFRGNIAEDIAYQINLKQITENDETATRFENFLNEDATAQQEIANNNERISATTSQVASEVNGQVQREKIELPKIEVIVDQTQYDAKMKKLGYSETDLDNLTLDQKRDIVSNKQEKAVVENSATLPTTENKNVVPPSTENKIADIKRRMEEEFANNPQLGEKGHVGLSVIQAKYDAELAALPKTENKPFVPPSTESISEEVNKEAEALLVKGVKDFTYRRDELVREGKTKDEAMAITYNEWLNTKDGKRYTQLNSNVNGQNQKTIDDFKRDYESGSLNRQDATGSRNIGIFSYGDKIVKIVKSKRAISSRTIALMRERLVGMDNVFNPIDTITLEDGSVAIMMDKASGKDAGTLSKSEIDAIPQEHWDNFEKTVRELSEKGVKVDLTKRSNLFYDTQKGFQFLDIDNIQENPTAKFITDENGKEQYYPFERTRVFPKDFVSAKQMFEDIKLNETEKKYHDGELKSENKPIQNKPTESISEEVKPPSKQINKPKESASWKAIDVAQRWVKKATDRLNTKKEIDPELFLEGDKWEEALDDAEFDASASSFNRRHDYAMEVLSDLKAISEQAGLSETDMKFLDLAARKIVDKLSPSYFENSEFTEGTNLLPSKSENKPIQNEGTTGAVNQPISTEAEQSNKQGTEGAVQQNTDGTDSPTADAAATVPVRKYTERAKSVADKIRNAELPQWLVNTDSNTQQSGISGNNLKNALADAVEAVGKLLDSGIELKDAINTAFADFKKVFTDANEPFDEKQLKEGFKGQMEGLFTEDTPETLAAKIKNDEINYDDAIEGKSQEFIKKLDKALFGSEKFKLNEEVFKKRVRDQKDYGISEADIVANYEAIKKLTKRQKEIIAEVFGETAATDKEAKELQEAFKQLAKGEKPKAVLKRLGISDVTHLVKALSDFLGYKAVSNVQLEAMADYIVDSIELDKSDKYIHAMIDNGMADVKQLLRAKLIVALQDSGNEALATQLVNDMANDAVSSGRQTQSLKKAYEILGAKGNPKMRTAFQVKYAESVQKKALEMNKKLAEMVSNQEAEIGRLNERIHNAAQKSSAITKIKELISNLCNLRGKK